MVFAMPSLLTAAHPLTAGADPLTVTLRVAVHFWTVAQFLAVTRL
jgi:hypothetical protein